MGTTTRESNGYGKWWPGADEFLGRVRGRAQRVMMHTERWEGGIEYSVSVQDPDATGAYEQGEDEREVWRYSGTFKAGQEAPAPWAVEAAREQERIADEIAARYLAGAVT